MNLVLATLLSFFLLCGSALGQSLLLGPAATTGSGMSATGVGVGHTFGTCFVWNLNDTLTFRADQSGVLGFDGVDCADVANNGDILATLSIDFNGMDKTAILLTGSIFAPIIGELPGTAFNFGLGISSDAVYRAGVSTNGIGTDGRGWWESSVGGAVALLSEVTGEALSTNISPNGDWISIDYFDSGGPQTAFAVREIRSSGAFAVMNSPAIGGNAGLNILDDGTLMGWEDAPDPFSAGLIEAPVYWTSASNTAVPMSLLDAPGCSSPGEDYAVLAATPNGEFLTGLGCDGTYDVVWLGGGVTATTFEDYAEASGVVFPPGLSVTSVEGFNDAFDRFMTTVDDNGTSRAAVIELPEPSLGMMLSVGVVGLALLANRRKE